MTAGLDSFIQDLRYGARILRRSPGFAAVAVLCLAFGIGATTAAFSLIYGILLQPLPYRSPEQLVAVWNSPVQNSESKVFAQLRDFENWRDHARSFSEIAAATWAIDARKMTGHGAPRKVLVIPASEGLFRLLGVSALLGRTFLPEDLSKGCSVVLAHRFWANALGANRSIVGRAIRLDDEACTVLGVMPDSFSFFPEPAQAWSLIHPAGASERTKLVGGVGVFARLRSGVTRAAAEAELKSLAAALDGGVRYGVRMQPVVRPLQDEFTWLAGRNLRTSLMLLFGAVTAVLLIACFNVANLLVGRSIAREREMAVRAALGSGRRRLIRQLLTENLILALLSASLGTLFAFGAPHLFRILRPIELPVGSSIGVNLQVLAFTAAIAALTTVLFGFVPAWRMSHSSLNTALKSGARALAGSRPLAGAFVAAEVAFSLPLLVAAVLLIRSILAFASTPLGFDYRQLVRIPVSVSLQLTPEQRMASWRQLINEASETAEFSHVSLSTAVPVRGGKGSDVLVIEGRREPTPDNAITEIAQQSVSDQYFTCMSIPLRSGRAFAPADTDKAPAVAIVNEQLAHKYFPNQDPTGRRIRILGESGWSTIVGIAADEKRTTPFHEMAWVNPPIVYRPLAQRPPDSADLLVRGRAAGQIQRKLQQRHSDMLIAEPEPVSSVIDAYLRYPRFRAILAAAFGSVALILAVAGLYGVLAQAVAQRTREVGLRMALGAQRRRVVSMILGQGMKLALAGSAAGLLLTWWTSRSLVNLLYGVTPLDPATILLVTLLLIAVAFAAMCIPALRAAGVDPVSALREE